MTEYNLKKGGRRLLRMGFWCTEGGHLNRPGDFDDEIAMFGGGQSCDREDVLAYMASARVGKRYRGMAECRICEEKLGNSDMVSPDGVWTFPQGWEHYIIFHGFIPTEPQFAESAVKWYGRVKEDGWT